MDKSELTLAEGPGLLLSSSYIHPGKGQIPPAHPEICLSAALTQGSVMSKQGKLLLTLVCKVREGGVGWGGGNRGGEEAWLPGLIQSQSEMAKDPRGF